MPARRLPTKVLELHGARRSRLEARAGEPQIDSPLGHPPGHITKGAAKIWNRIAKDAYWLRATHRDVLEMFAVYKDMFEEDPREMHAAKVAQMMRAAIELGLTAVAQTRVHAPEKPKEETNPFAQFAS